MENKSNYQIDDLKMIKMLIFAWILNNLYVYLHRNSIT